ncbi:MAG TPA: hypothetical protein VLD67_04490 [Vicinamibacterales bacterium]|nr:hypothetical protein [Vicinamibacterales bacterium]
MRCLVWDPSRRLQTMKELKQALQQAMHVGTGGQASIAVLPFANLSADPENEYLGDGLAEEIINALAQSGRFDGWLPSRLIPHRHRL